jgi:hypothetical protein
VSQIEHFCISLSKITIKLLINKIKKIYKNNLLKKKKIKGANVKWGTPFWCFYFLFNFFQMVIFNKFKGILGRKILKCLTHDSSMGGPNVTF